MDRTIFDASVIPDSDCVTMISLPLTQLSSSLSSQEQRSITDSKNTIDRMYFMKSTSLTFVFYMRLLVI